MSISESKLTKRKNIISFAALLIALVLVNFIAQHIYYRIDLTSDKRYTLSKASFKVMDRVDDIVSIRIYLEGEMPVSIKKFQRAISEMLSELKNYTGNDLQFEFINPAAGSEEERDAIYTDLFKKGLQPLTIQENDTEGGATQRLLFPGAIINYKGKERIINFVQNNPMYSSEENLNFAQQNLEYTLVSTIEQIIRQTKPIIAFIEGHGELDDYQIGDISKELSGYYSIERIKLHGSEILDPNEYKVIIIAKPLEPWNEADKLAIDQYIMNGGRVAWFVDAVHVHEDSLANGEMTFGMICEHNLNDQLFRYGVRVNANVIEDLQSAMVQVNIAPVGMPADFRLAPWLYFPLLIPPGNNPITKGLNLIRSQYPGVIDTVGVAGKVKKTILLHSSENSKITNAPLMVSLLQVNDKVTEMEFSSAYLPVAVALEGVFDSPFRNRMAAKEFPNYKAESIPNKMIIVSDGDIIRNEVSRRADRTNIFPLGFDRNVNQTYGNKEFVKNIINYLADEEGLMELRNRELQLRLLDKSKLAHNHYQIIIINTIVPILLVIIMGAVFLYIRKRKYAK